MICKGKYSKKEDIPDGLDSEFELRNGEYYLKESAIDGGDEIFASGAVANKTRAMNQLKTKKEELEDAKETIKELEEKVKSSNVKDGTVLSPEEAKTWKAYQELGALKDVKKMVEEFPQLTEKLTNISETGSLEQFSKDSGLNLDVLKDWKFDKTKGEGIEFFLKDDIQKIKGVDTKVKVPMARLKEKDETSGEVKVTEHPVLDVAKKRLSYYQVEALTKASPNQDSKIVLNNSPEDSNNIYIPNLGSGGNEVNNSGDGKKEKPVDTFNKERDSKPSPFDPPKTT
ncbi:MAG: hypothetical protein KG003_08125 [Bacteroidetes bacterium]|nr:hypothetical protein [Bacteroidota bacterium]